MRQGIEFWAVNTDAQALMNHSAENKVQIGNELTRGLGCGGSPELGAQAALESQEELRSMLQVRLHSAFDCPLEATPLRDAPFGARSGLCEPDHDHEEEEEEEGEERRCMAVRKRRTPLWGVLSVRQVSAGPWLSMCKRKTGRPWQVWNARFWYRCL